MPASACHRHIKHCFEDEQQHQAPHALLGISAALRSAAGCLTAYSALLNSSRGLPQPVWRTHLLCGTPPLLPFLKHIHWLAAGTRHAELNVEAAGAAAKLQQAHTQTPLQIQPSGGRACRSCSRAATRCSCRRRGRGARCWASGGLRGAVVASSWPPPRQADRQSSSLLSCCIFISDPTMAVAPVIGVHTCAVHTMADTPTAACRLAAASTQAECSMSFKPQLPAISHAGRLLMPCAHNAQHHALPCPAPLARRVVTARPNIHALQSAMPCRAGTASVQLQPQSSRPGAHRAALPPKSQRRLVRCAACPGQQGRHCKVLRPVPEGASCTT